MPSPYDQYDLILTQRNSSDTHFQEVRVADVPSTVVSFDGSSTLRTWGYSEADDSGSLIRRDSSDDAAIGSRLYFTDASASNGTTALIGLNASTARDFAIYDYASGGGYLLNIYSGSKDVEIHGGLVQNTVTRIDSSGSGYFNNISASSISVSGSLYVQSGVYGILIGTADTASYVSPSGNAYVQGGNSFGQTASIGTNDTHSLHLETSGSTRVAITPSGLVGVNTVSPSYTLEVNGTFAANTKSFKIDHPTKEGYKLIYGSLESPYHGVRLTGKGSAVKGYDKVVLPEYIFKLVRHNDINIQVTNIRHSRVMYVNEVNVSENYFVIAYDKQMFDGDKTFEFYWDFTAERQDIDKLESEVKA